MAEGFFHPSFSPTSFSLLVRKKRRQKKRHPAGIPGMISGGSGTRPARRDSDILADTLRKILPSIDA